MKKVGMYLRVSTDRQAQEGDSIPAQRSALEGYIKIHPDMVMIDEYLDDGISGTKEDRDEFQRMLTDVKAGKIDLILVTKMDRLHRSLRNFLNMQDILDKNHAHWLAIWEPMYDSSTPQGRMIINTMMNLAQFEAEQTGQRIRQVFGYKSQQKEVLSGKVPLGYRIEGKKVVKDELAPAILDTFQYFSNTTRLWDTKKHLENEHGIVRTQNAIKKMLKNEKYTGEWYGVVDFCEPIIPRQLFDDVQRKLLYGSRCTAKRTYIFTGLLVCGTCGGRLTPLRATNGKFYYRCRRHYNRDAPACTNSKSINESIVEERMLSELRQRLENRIVEMKAIEHKPKDNKTKITAIQAKIDRLKELYVNGLIDIEEYKKDKAQYSKELSELMREDTEFKDTSRYEELIRIDIEDLYRTFSREEKRMFWQAVISKITFTEDRETIPDIL